MSSLCSYRTYTHYLAPLYNIAMPVSIKVVVMGIMNATSGISVYIMIKMIVRGNVVLQG